MAATNPTCSICAGSSAPAFMSGEYRMYRCTACGTAFVSPTPSAEQLTRFYDNYHLSAVEGGWYDQIEDRMREDFPTKVGLVQSVGGKTPGRVLDVGCGKGYFVKACVDAGIDAEGIDLSASGVEYARKTLGVKAMQGLIEEKRGELGVFDHATFWATIEHLPDPVGTVRAIGSVLKPGGYLLMDTGIGDDRLDRLLPGRVQWYDPPQHLFVFSGSGMKRLVEAAGFELVRLDTSFERSKVRRYMKAARNYGAALGLRAMAEFARLKHGEFVFTRFPMGNLMSVVARKV